MEKLMRDRPATVMVVDDDEISNGLVSMFLNYSGLDVISAASGEEALDLLAAAPRIPDLILTDMLMPGMDGSQLLARLQAGPTTKQVPVIILSGLDANEGVAHKAAAQGYLKKPVHLDELTVLIKRYLP